MLDLIPHRGYRRIMGSASVRTGPDKGRGPAA